MPVSDYDPIFEEAGREWNVDPALLRSIAHQESGGNRNAKSSAGARGVMQIMPPTGADLGVTDFSDPAQSIFAGAKYMRQMMDRYKDKPNATQLAVAAYNAGPDRVDAWISGKGSLPNETQAYLPAIGAHYAKYSKAAPQGAAPASAPAGKDDSGVPSDEDFLKQVAPKAEPKAAPIPNDDDFLKGVGAKPVEPEKQAEMPGMEGMNEPTIGVGPSESEKPTSAPPTSAAARIGNAMSDAYNNAPNPLMTENFQHALEDSGAIGRGTAAVLDSAGKLIRFIPAGVAGGMAAVGEGATALGAPSLGRDLNIASQVVPMAHMGTGVPALAGAPKAAPRFVGEHFGELTPADTVAAPLSQEFRANPLAPGAAEKVAAAPQNALTADQASPVPTMVVRPEPAPVEAAGPKSVGAAASREQTPSYQIELKPAEIQAYRSTAEGQKLLESQQPGVQDRNAYIKGVQPNSAEIEQTVNEARDLKALGQKHQDISQEAQVLADANNEARKKHFADLAQSPVDVENAKATRKAQAESDLKETFGNKKAADTQPVVDAIKNVLNDARGSENTALQTHVKPFLDRLYDADGDLKTDPERLYGLREDVARMQSKAARAQTPTLDHVTGELQTIKEALDQAIESGAPGYKKYLSNYAEASRPIDRMQVLQDFEPKLFSTKNRMDYAPVQRMMKSIVDARKSPGINKFKSLTDEDMDRLWALRDDLRRSASAKELASAYGGGSDTVPNALDQAKNLAVGAVKGGAELAAHGAANWVAPVAGSLVVNHVKGIGSHILNRRQTRKELERGKNMLHPKVELRNPLDYP